MSWPKYILLAWYAYVILYGIMTTGKERTPTTPATTAIGVVMVAGLAWLVVIA